MELSAYPTPNTDFQGVRKKLSASYPTPYPTPWVGQTHGIPATVMTGVPKLPLLVLTLAIAFSLRPGFFRERPARFPVAAAGAPVQLSFDFANDTKNFYSAKCVPTNFCFWV